MIQATSNNGGVAITAGDTLPVAIANGNDIELRAEGDIYHTVGSTAGNAVLDALTFVHEDTDSVGANNIGLGIAFQLDDAGGIEEQGSIDLAMDDVTNGSEESRMVFYVQTAGTITEAFKLSGNTSGTNVTVDFNGEVKVRLDGGANTEAVCGDQADGDIGAAGADDVTLGDCATVVTADYAERYPTQVGITFGEIVVPGSTLVRTYDSKTGEQFIAQAVRSSTPYQGPVYGIVSNNFGDFTSAGGNIALADNPMPVALVGRLPVKVVAEGGSISIGDYLTTSSTPGAAMKATQAGRVIGMALANWDGSSATVMVQVINTWYQPPVSESSSLQGGSSSALSATDSISVADGSFSGSVTIAEHLYGSQDMAGRVRLASGKTSVRVAFEVAYDYLPIITFSSRSNSDSALGAWISNEDTTGFTINRPNSDAQVEFNWIAIGVEDAQVTVSDANYEGFDISVTDLNGPPPPAPTVVEEEASSSEPASAEEPAEVAP